MASTLAASHTLRRPSVKELPERAAEQLSRIKKLWDRHERGDPYGPEYRASVLVPLIYNSETSAFDILLTRRSTKLRSHSGEVAFPGGRRDEGDENVVTTALREAYEEVGLPPSCVNVITRWPPIVSRNNLLVTPVIALTPPDFTPTPNPDEVESVFKVPTTHFLSAGHYWYDTLMWNGTNFRLHRFSYGDYVVSGLTADVCIQVAMAAHDIQDEALLGYNLSEPGQTSYEDLIEKLVREGRFTKPDLEFVKKRNLKETPVFVDTRVAADAMDVDLGDRALFSVVGAEEEGPESEGKEAPRTVNGRM
ncbi:hypothetical protein M427DRAFT_61939 [Gonapodya prolifera JEL478]|uniref:Nudix hydrolase domain-containing protein n=1 Tax=Gonapodya prolifera (strain JEL478) TaxID=1344416 RepID=A0A139A1B5_GONPJ|nr:hypothetical protein M427DRAFT_61939 [Gonapodya prolifera JEL478]|eukprot:KXS10577.1 hypothetical protein M427DRAFT_61939 [Gonapodya prolifera JEL478]